MSGPWVNRLLAPPSLTKSPVIQPGSQPSFSISAIPPFRHTPAPAVRFKPCLSAEEIKVGGHLRPPIGASQRATLPAHDYFGQILDSDGTVLLCLHKWGAHEHPSLMSPDRGTPGNGLLLFFRVDDFDLALQRARSLVSRLEEEPHLNSNTRTNEFSLRDPDGYYVTISALSGD